METWHLKIMLYIFKPVVQLQVRKNTEPRNKQKTRKPVYKSVYNSKHNSKLQIITFV